MKPNRLGALRRFAVAISILNLLGHTVLGFEQSWAQLVVALFTAYATELLLDFVDAAASGHSAQISRLGLSTIDFLLPAHITGLACSMLLYGNDRLGVFAFAAGSGIASKYIFRVRISQSAKPASNDRPRHFFNPSNTGIVFTLLAFPWVGIAPPYQFTESVSGFWDWAIPGIIICTGSFLNAKFTGKWPFIGTWLGSFILQAVLRSSLTGASVFSALGPMTGLAFLLFTFYMVSDPATTPNTPRGQMAFGASVAGAYAALQLLHVVYGLFFALFTVCCARGAWYAFRAWFGTVRSLEASRSASIPVSEEREVSRVAVP